MTIYEKIKALSTVEKKYDIQTKFLELSATHATAVTTIKILEDFDYEIADGSMKSEIRVVKNVIGTASVTAGDFKNYIEVAEERAIQRAITLLGIDLEDDTSFVKIERAPVAVENLAHYRKK